MAIAIEKEASVRSRMNTALREAVRLQSESAIPAEFKDAFAFGLNRCGLTLTSLCKELGEELKLSTEDRRKLPRQVKTWLYGDSMPHRFKGFAAVAAIERRLEFAPGALWSRVKYRIAGGGNLPKSALHSAIPDNRRIRCEISWRAPDDILTKPQSEQWNITLAIWQKVAKLREENIDAHHAALTKKPYRHRAKKWLRTLVDDVGELFSFHKENRLIDYRNPVFVAFWTDGTCGKNIVHIERTLGAIMKRHPELGALDMTLALFAVPQLVWESIEYVKVRRASEEYDGVDHAVMNMAREFLRKGGFFRLCDGYEERLPALARDICAAEFPDARSWTDLCDAAVTKYDDLMKTVADTINGYGPKLSKPKKQIVQPLRKDPAGYVEAIAQSARIQLDKADPNSRNWRYRVRGFVERETGDQTTFRNRTDRETTWRADNTGKLRFDGMVWRLHMNVLDFKNGQKSDHFKDDQDPIIELRDVNGLYEALHDYTRPGGARDQILAGRKSDYFIVKNSDVPGHDNESLGCMVEKEYLMANATSTDERFDEVYTHRVHARRKLNYNAIKKKKGKLAAANALVISTRVGHKNYDFTSPSEMLAVTPEHRDQEHRRRKPTK